MEWIIIIYLAIGVIKTMGTIASDNPGAKPMWMHTETNGLKMAIMFTIYSLIWPFTK